jgi:hypothetical protein
MPRRSVDVSPSPVHTKSTQRRFFLTPSVALAALLCLWLGGCAQEYEGRAGYSSLDCREVIQLDGSKYPVFPIFLGRALFPVFICATFQNNKMCLSAEVASNGECRRLYAYERAVKGE